MVEMIPFYLIFPNVVGFWGGGAGGGGGANPDPFSTYILTAGNGRSHSRQMRPNIGLGDEILPSRSPRE